MKKHLVNALIISLPLVITACATASDVQTAAPQKIAAKPTEPATPSLASKAREAQEMVINWQNLGLKAFAQYQEKNSIYAWSLLQTSLPNNTNDAEKVVADAAIFAKQANKPVQIILTTPTQKTSAQLSNAIRDAAAKSGGTNQVKFDRVIDSRVPSMLQLRVLEDK